MNKNDLPAETPSVDQAAVTAIENSAEQAKQLEDALRNMKPDELLELAEFYLETTDVVMEGASMANNLDIGQATLMSALMRTRDGLEKVITWLSLHFDLKEEEENTPSTETTPQEGEDFL